MLRSLAGHYPRTFHLTATKTKTNLPYQHQLRLKMSASGPFTVVVHPFESETRHSCGYEIGNTSARNALVVIGGLSDGPHTVPVVRPLAKHFDQDADLDYSIFEYRMRSSFTGFGQSSLANDVADTSALVKYLRGLGKEKIVLMGHSTGCQDCMEYTHYSKHDSEPVDGFILQGGISDRDILEHILDNPQRSIDLASKMIAEGKADHMMPNDMIPSVLGAPISAYRFHSLAAKGGDDDYFSADLEHETVNTFWSRFQKPVLVLHSGEDEYVPEEVDQAASNKRYQAASSFVSPLSGLIPGASHTVDQPEAQEWFAKRVGEFLKTLN